MNGQLEGYHVYSIVDPGSIFSYIDGKESWRSKRRGPHVPEYVILSTEIQDKGWAGDIPSMATAALMKHTISCTWTTFVSFKSKDF